jgi:hypothetical protein
MVADTLNMRDLRQWLCWRIEERDGKPTKVPYDPSTGEKADSTNPKTWTRYEKAVSVCKKHGYDGIGFVFTPEDDLCGVDLDKCLDPATGEIEGWAQQIVEELDSYTEISPSGRGVHILVRGKLPAGRNRKGHFEAYDQGRYFTITGEHLSGSPQGIESRQDGLLAVVRRVFGEESANGHTKPLGVAEVVDTGLSDSEIIRKALAASSGERFSRLWSGDTSGYGSHSEADLALCGMLAFWAGGDDARIDTLFRQSGLYRKKWDRKDYRDRTITEALSGKTEFYKVPKTVKLADGTEIVAEDEAEERKPTQAELLIRCAAEAELFHTPAGDSYATIPVSNHRETYPVKAKGFRRWLVRAYFERYDRPPGNQALQDALGLLEARALFDGPEREVYVRVAGHAGNIYIDLANEDWQVVEITPADWRMVSGEGAPVRFRRPRGMLALPTPLPASDGNDGCDGLLRRFFNVSDEKDLRLIVAWLVAAMRPTGPYPVLLLQGEQGSAKSTAERLVRALADPSAAPLRTTPRSEHDLFIAADNAHVIALDNISTLPPWLSDALCRLSTGGGFSTRTLYENREEELFDGMKPVILNGITDVATRPDLLDRALIVSLPPIPDEERKPEADLWRAFELARPAILAALFDAVSGALRSVEDVRLEGMPRMADFAVWATAAEESLGWQPDAFMEAYSGNRQEATDNALEADPVAVAVLDFMADREQWAGSATELWTALGGLTDEGVRHTKAWPGAPNALTGRLKRLAPTLRGVGIEYGEDRSGRSRKKVLTKNKPARDRHHRHHRHDEELSAKESQMRGDGPGDGLSGGDGPHRHRDDPAQKTVIRESRIDKGNAGGRGGRDGDDGDMQADSKSGASVWENDPMRHYGRKGGSA